MIIGETITKQFLFGIVQHEQAGDVELLTVFGMKVFERVGDYSFIFGVAWSQPNE